MDSKGTKRAVKTITLPTITAVALWTYEITGQISDGMWENTTPHGHFKFWCMLEAKHVPDADPIVLDSSGYCMKSNYNLLKLLDLGKEDAAHRFCVRDRMIAQAKMALALKKLGLALDYGSMHAAAHMPETLDAWRASAATWTWDADFIAKYMEDVTDGLAFEFYAAKYDQRDLKRDLALIKAAMKTARA
jgi:hypothetical protein